MLFQGRTTEYLLLEEITNQNCYLLNEKIESGLTLIWFTEGESELLIDKKSYSFCCDQIVCLTEFHEVEVPKISTARLVRFNRPFYCVAQHDSEISCKGILFFGASQLPIINIPKEDSDKFDTLWKMFVLEMGSQDKLQLEMLQMMLKRLLILSTRLYKENHGYNSLSKDNQSLVREFNYLVEQHFRTKHTVTEYAELLHKSPKTISNLFSKLGAKKPLEFIQQRKLLEARRLLTYTDKPIKEVAYAIGFEDIQTFSRFFKKKEGVSPSKYKAQYILD